MSATPTRALMITTGTTGLPKAAGQRPATASAMWSHWFAGLADMRGDDRMYNCLPMYHSVGGIVAIGAALVNGGSAVVQERFSARQFWDDIARWDCTLFQYIGELCRYLVAAPPHPAERRRHLRLACGNGMSGDVWTKFQERFCDSRAHPGILRGDGGNVLALQCRGKNRRDRQGSGSFLAARSNPIALVRLDHETGASLYAAPDGFRRIRCARRASRARRSAASVATGAILPTRFLKRLRRRRPIRKRKSCATSSPPTTPTCAAAISCAWTRKGSIISSTASAPLSVGRERECRDDRSRPRCSCGCPDAVNER